MIKIRKAIIEDSAKLSMLSQQLGYSISEQQTLQNLEVLMQSKYDEVFVAELEQMVVGWVGVAYKVSIESPPLCEIHGLVVDEHFRGRGIGKMLIEKAKQWSLERVTGKLRLRCNIKRIEALLFYGKVGFSEVKQQKVLEISLEANLS